MNKFHPDFLADALIYKQIIRRAMSDASYINQLEGRVREIVIDCYVSGLKNTYGRSSLYLLS